MRIVLITLALVVYVLYFI